MTGAQALDALPSDYLGFIAEQLDRALDAPLSLTNTLREGHGAFPDILFRVIDSVRGGRKVPTRVEREPAFEFEDELHPLLFEWYFTKPSAHFVAEVAASSADEWLCLGTPSIAAELTGHRGNLRLIDADHAVTSRFPALAEASGVYFREVGDAPAIDPAGATVIDPPWYLVDVLRWLRIAHSHTREGGTIIAPIFPELTRPTAWDERERLIAAAQSIGRVELHPVSVAYSTPRFELETFGALGLPDPGDWRVADLMVIRDVGGRPSWPSGGAVHLADRGWSTYKLDKQVVKVRDLPSQFPVKNSPAISAIDGCPGHVLTSVSERDPRRSSVGLWTSRNRVALVGNVELVRTWMRLLERPETRDALLDNPPDAPSFDLLLQVLGL